MIVFRRGKGMAGAGVWGRGCNMVLQKVAGLNVWLFMLSYNRSGVSKEKGQHTGDSMGICRYLWKDRITPLWLI